MKLRRERLRETAHVQRQSDSGERSCNRALPTAWMYFAIAEQPVRETAPATRDDDLALGSGAKSSDTPASAAAASATARRRSPPSGPRIDRGGAIFEPARWGRGGEQGERETVPSPSQQPTNHNVVRSLQREKGMQQLPASRAAPHGGARRVPDACGCGAAAEPQHVSQDDGSMARTFVQSYSAYIRLLLSFGESRRCMHGSESGLWAQNTCFPHWSPIPSERTNRAHCKQPGRLDICHRMKHTARHSAHQAQSDKMGLFLREAWRLCPTPLTQGAPWAVSARVFWAAPAPVPGNRLKFHIWRRRVELPALAGPQKARAVCSPTQPTVSPLSDVMLRRLAAAGAQALRRSAKGPESQQRQGLGLGATLGFTALVGLTEVTLADEAEHGCAAGSIRQSGERGTHLSTFCPAQASPGLVPVAPRWVLLVLRPRLHPPRAPGVSAGLRGVPQSEPGCVPQPRGRGVHGGRGEGYGRGD